MTWYSSASPFDEYVVEATSESNVRLDWGKIGAIRYEVLATSDGPKDCLRAIVKMIYHRTPQISLQALDVLLDKCVLICGKKFHLAVSSTDFVSEVKKILTGKQTHRAVSNKMKQLVVKWAEGKFKYDSQLRLIADLYSRLKHEGVDFSGQETLETCEKNQSQFNKDLYDFDLQQEDDDIAKAIDVVVRQLTRMRSKMDEMRRQESGTDVVIRCKDGTLHAHKLVLTASSSYFETMLGTNMSEDNLGVINFSMVDKHIIEVVIHYLYTAQLPNLNNDDNFVKELISTCHMMQIQDLLFFCWDRLTEDISMETFPKLWTLAAQYEICQPDCKLQHFIRNNMEKIAENDNIQLLTETEMIKFIQCFNDPLWCNVIAKCIFKWRSNGDENREEFAVRLFKKIHLNKLDDKTLYELLGLNCNGEVKTVQDLMVGEAVARFPDRFNALKNFAKIMNTNFGSKMQHFTSCKI
uniref:BTB domain-containing protein n=1 Tax=Strigamia maritima TaxID=126957 RepID=T1ITB6_STRMM